MTHEILCSAGRNASRGLSALAELLVCAGEDGQELPLTCVHPISRRHHRLPIVVVQSQEHDSTGSTVDTFLPQGDLTASYIRVPLSTVLEELSDD